MKVEEQKNAPKKWNDKFKTAGSFDNLKHNKSHSTSKPIHNEEKDGTIVGKRSNGIKRVIKKSFDPVIVGVTDGEAETQEICYFCQRPRPIFLVDQDDMILRLPERFLPPFLKNLKLDFLHKKLYLKYLRITSKLIHVCSCRHKLCHAYCATAFVLRSQKIYCKDCFAYYHLYVKSERIFSSEYLYSSMKLLTMYILFGAMIYGIAQIDNLLKVISTKQDMREEMKKNSGSIDSEAIDELKVNNSFVMIPLGVVLTIIMIWCFYLRFVMAFMKRKRMIWVEVQDC